VSNGLLDLSVRSLYLKSSGVGPRLRVGVLLDTSDLPACFREVLVDIAASNFADLVAVVYNDERRASPVARRSLARRAGHALLSAQSWHSVLLDAYLRFIDSRFHPEPDPLAPAGCADLVAGCAALHVTPQRRGFVQRFPEPALAWLREQRLDVILRFGFDILHGDVLATARCGVWSYHHGDSQYYRGGPPMMWELLERNPVSGVVLQVLDERLDAGLVLCKALLATSPAPSVTANRFAPFWVAEHFVIRKLKELHESGWDAVRAGASPPATYLGRKAIYRSPRNGEMARWLAPLVGRAIRSRLRRDEAMPHWQIALRQAATPLYDDWAVAQLDQFRLIESPRGRFWADPFLLEHDQKRWVVFEEFDYYRDIGTLRCAEVDDGGALGPAHDVLERPYHLSYPCVFRDGDDLYLIPESQAGGGVDLYRAKRFPSAWEHVTRLLNFPAVDATPFRHNDQWWMFASPMTVVGHAPITLLFHAPTLTGPWKQAKASPVSSDVREARCAGAVIAAGTRLLRPAQDCSRTYGGALLFHEVLTLSESAYVETPRARIEPWRKDQVGLHTYNRVGDWEVIDVKLRRRTADIY
jgi:hypothetical protein